MTRYLAITVGSALISASAGSLAQQPAQTRVSPEMKQVMMDWGVCRGTYTADRANTRTSATAVIDAALAHCKALEDRAMALWLRDYGRGSRHQFVAGRTRIRAQGIQSLQSVRTGAPVSDPHQAWGLCVGNHIRNNRASGRSVGNAAEAALQACLPHQNRLADSIRVKHGPAAARRHMLVLRAEVRKLAISTSSTGG